MKKVTLLAIGIVFCVIVSCGLKKAASPEMLRPMKQKSAPSPIVQKTQDSVLNIQPPPLFEELAPGYKKDTPLSTPEFAKGDFSFTDKHGVHIEKKNGIQTTTLPNGEKYLLPDEI